MGLSARQHFAGIVETEEGSQWRPVERDAQGATERSGAKSACCSLRLIRG
jgi:hypothetical protein